MESGRKNKKITGLIGYPLGHTLSPVMHNAVFKKKKMNWEYRVFELKPREKGKFIKKMKKEKIAGINVTVPYKQSIMKYLDKTDRAAAAIGAVNTVKNRNSKPAGYNTDYTGFEKSLDKNKIKVKGKNVVLFGAGGAAHAVVYALKKRKPEMIDIINIDIPMARRLVKKLKPKNARIWILKKTKVIDVLVKKADFVINATSVGLDKKSNPYKISGLKKKGIPVYDVIYNPAVTPFLKQAKKKGGKIINGLDMLIYQGMESFRIWTGRQSDYNTVKKAVNSFLRKK